MSFLEDITSSVYTFSRSDFVKSTKFILSNILYIGYFAICWCVVNISSVLFTLLIKLLEICGRKRIIMDRTDEEPYLERYYLFLKDRDSFPFNIFIHKFLKSDPDDLHDHPWGFRTFILKGGYWEHTDSGKFWRAPGFTQSVGPNYKHRVELDAKTTCWTLFIPYRRVREWGFYRDDKWIESEEYFRIKKSEAAKKKY